MPTLSETSDESLLAILRREGSMTVAEMAKAMSVTATAVRQRINRLMAQGFVQREVHREDSARPGRPTHRYLLTSKAQRFAGDNFADLAAVLWEEIRSIKDEGVRRGLLQRISAAFAHKYRGRVQGRDAAERMEALQQLFAERRIPLSVIPPADAASDSADDSSAEENHADSTGKLPILRVEHCPYPELAEQDRGICAMEKMVFAELIGDDLRLSQCRLDGHPCCEFEARG